MCFLGCKTSTTASKKNSYDVKMVLTMQERVSRPANMGLVASRSQVICLNVFLPENMRLIIKWYWLNLCLV